MIKLMTTTAFAVAIGYSTLFTSSTYAGDLGNHFTLQLPMVKFTHGLDNDGQRQGYLLIVQVFRNLCVVSDLLAACDECDRPSF